MGEEGAGRGGREGRRRLSVRAAGGHIALMMQKMTLNVFRSTNIFMNAEYVGYATLARNA